MSTDTTPPRRRLPLTVIGGFLGAGKTTLLNRWLREANGQRLAVLVNDFGALNIDAELIASNSGDTVALSNGCVCCQIGDDLSAALIGVLESAERFDAVVIEASGVSDPWRIAQLGRADPDLSLDGVIVLVDAEAALAQSRDPLLADTLERQLKAADLIVVNKVDRVDAGLLARTREWLTSVAGAMPQYPTTQAEVPLAMLSGLALSRLVEQHSHVGASEACEHDHADHDHVDHGAQFETWSCKPLQTFEVTALRATLKSLPNGVLRLKGLVRSAEHGWSELQFAGRHGSVQRASVSPVNPALVAIGLRGTLPRSALDSLFEQALVETAAS